MLGILIFITLSLFKFSYALLISVLTCIIGLIPVFGALIAMLIGRNNPVDTIIFIIIFKVIQQIKGNFIYPKVVGTSLGLSPLRTLLAITVYGNTFGIIGTIIALPIASVAYAIFREYINKKIDKKALN